MNVVFIAFMARSGSTWLGKILSAHPQVLYHQHVWYNGKGKLTEQDKARFDRTLKRLWNYGGHDYDCRPYFPQPQAPQVMVLKDSHAAQDPELLLRHGRMIVLIRNPFAQVNSLINNYPPGKGYGIEASAKRWARRNDLYLELAAKHPDKVTRVLYEDLADTPAMQAPTIVKWMGLDWDTQIEKFIWDSTRRHENHHQSVFKDPGQVQAQWRLRLSPWAVKTITNAVKGSKAGRLYGIR